MPTPCEEGLPRRETITLGVYTFTHLGDCLCITPLPRMLRTRSDLDVFVSDQPNCRAVFANNPHVIGFAGGGMPVFASARGNGHWIQRIQQGFDLPIDPIPKPELYLREAERNWAARQRQLFPQDRPMCVLSASVVSGKRVACQSRGAC